MPGKCYILYDIDSDSTLTSSSSTELSSHSPMAKNMFLKETNLADEFLSSSDIPKIGELLKSAGFEDHSDSWWELKNRIRYYAQKHYKTASKIPGSGLNDWNSRTVRYELGLMALHFLEVYGVKYWGAPTRRELEYPRDKVR